MIPRMLVSLHYFCVRELAAFLLRLLALESLFSAPLEVSRSVLLFAFTFPWVMRFCFVFFSLILLPLSHVSEGTQALPVHIHYLDIH